MASTSLTVAKKQYTDVATLLKDPSIKAKLQNYVDEILICKTKILDHQESIKTLKQTAVDELQIDPKIFMNIVGLYFNNNFQEKQDELDKFSQVIDLLTKDE